MNSATTPPHSEPGSTSDPKARRRPGPWAVAALVVYWVALGIATHIPLRMARRVQHGDKVVHALAYAGLASLLFVSVAVFRRVTWRTQVVLLAVLAAYATADELLQDFVPRRTSDFKDWCADLLGASVSLTLCWLVAAFLTRRSPHRSSA